jgi:hypothetical protein
MLLSKRKRYLSGSDWVINTMDHMMKDRTCAGNLSQIVLLFSAPLDEHEVRTSLNRFLKLFPVLEGSVARDFKLTPYWSIPAKSEREVFLAAHDVDDASSWQMLQPYLEKSVNRPFADEQDHLAFQLFTSREHSALSLTFDHRIFDARGAELLMNLFQQRLNNGGDPKTGDITFASSMELTQWSKKFLAGRNVNRRIIALSRSTPTALPVPDGDDRLHRYHRLSFSELETAALYERAYQEAGYLMESPYLLSVIIQSMHQVFRGRNIAGESYLIPVTLDLRPNKDPLQETFFNYVSYLFYQVPTTAVGDRKGLITLLKQQMFDQVKSGFPKDLAEASLLTRIAPLPLLGKLLHLPMKGKMATFAFSHLGRSSYQHPLFMDRKVTELFHMPRVPVPPGLGFFSNFYNNRLNLVISYLDGLLTDEEVQFLDQQIRKGFRSSSKID